MAESADGPIAVVALNLGGPDSLDDVKPFLRRLFADPDVIQLGWLRPLQPLFAWAIARSRAEASRAAYAQIGGKSPIRQETQAQAAAVTEALRVRGIPAAPYVAMGCWNPLPPETVAAMKKDGITRAVGLPLFPQHSFTTTGSVYKALTAAMDGSGIDLVRVDSYPDNPGYIAALASRIEDAIAALPEEHRASAPILFSAHGLPESYIQKGDRYLDEIRITVAAVTRKLNLGARASLCFQSRVGPQKWLSPYTEQALQDLAKRGEKAVVVVPVAFTGEHIETLQEIDILYREQALADGIQHFSRAATVGCHPDFIGGLADLVAQAARLS